MSDYAIGDVQGCYDPLMRLLDKLRFQPEKDTLWFVGDLVNRGPDSLKVLRFVHSLNKTYISLGNHDIHFLARLFLPWMKSAPDDTLAELIAAPDAEVLAHWLRQQNVLVYSSELSVVMCHAGIAPTWTLREALKYARELELALAGPDFKKVLSHLYGNKPDIWDPKLSGFERLRVICNYFTRMRCCDASGRMKLTFKESKQKIPEGWYPWFEVPKRREIKAHIVFGHWAALQGERHHANIHPIDTGCVWGGSLTALRLQDLKQYTLKK